MKRLTSFIIAPSLMAVVQLPMSAQTQVQVRTCPDACNTITLPAVLAGELLYQERQPQRMRYSSGIDYIDYSKYPSLDYGTDQFIITP